MRITKLSLTNFRSFKQTQTIEFAPVTLLFGPNSVGKSTVLMALFYLQQILQKGQCNPGRIDALGGKFVGGFVNLVHGKQLTESIKLKVGYNKGDAIGSSYTYLTDLIGDQIDLQMNSPISDAQDIALEFEISWSKSEKTAFISSYKVWFDDLEIAEVTSDAGLKQPMITSLNYLHPMLLPSNHDEWLLECLEGKDDIHEALYEKVLELADVYSPSHKECTEGEEMPFLNDENASDFVEYCFISEFHEQLVHDDNLDSLINCDGESILHNPFGIKGTNGALPALGRPLKTALSLDNEKLDAIVTELLSDVLVAPLDNLLSLLNDSLCIGPLRTIPDANFIPNPYPAQADWHDGRAAWDHLTLMDSSQLKVLNDWISKEDKLNTGYGIAIIKSYANGHAQLLGEFNESQLKERNESFNELQTKLIAATKSAFQKLEIQGGDELLAAKTEQTILATEKFRSEILGEKAHTREDDKFIYSLWDISANIAVEPSETGVGISQLMPLVIASIITSKGLISIEQPELHLHPRVQTAIGDLLTQLNSDVSFLLETHSEHLILRLLRRIRESSNQECPLNKKVTPNDVSVVYLNPSENGVKVIHYEITPDGDFTKDWPQGFFEERYEEQ